MINKLNNKLVIGLAIGLIVIATLMPRYFTHRRVIGKVLDTQILEKIEQVPVKRVTINSDNVSSVKDTNKNFKRYRLQIRYQYFAKGKRHVGLHKFGDYPGYLTELELINVKRKYLAFEKNFEFELFILFIVFGKILYIITIKILNKNKTHKNHKGPLVKRFSAFTQ